MASVSLFQLNHLSKEEGGRGLVKALQKWGAIPDQKTCHLCGKNMAFQKDGRGGFKWKCNKQGGNKEKCSYGITLTTDTMFYQSRVPLLTVVLYARMWVENSSQCKFNSIFGEKIAQQTLVNLGKLMRAIVFHSMFSNPEPVGGPGCTVEIDESKFGKRKYHKGHHVEGQWVFGGICRESGLCFMVPVKKRDSETLMPLIKQWILPGTTIISDCWRAYNNIIRQEGYGYSHLTVNHSLHYKDPDTGAHTNRIEGTWRPAKVMYGSSGRRKENFNGYLAKYMFLKRCKMFKRDPFEELMKAAGEIHFPMTEAFLEELYMIDG